MGFSEKDTLDLKPVNTVKPGGKRKRGRKRGLLAPAGIADWESHETALTFTDLLVQQAERDGADRREFLAPGSAPGWYLLEACGLVPYEPGKPPAKFRAEKSPVIKYPRPGQ